MTIQKNYATSDGKVTHFNITDISREKLNTIARALQARQEDAETASTDGGEALQEILVALQIDKDNEQVLNALG